MALSMPRPAPLSLPSPRFVAVWQRHIDVFRHLWVTRSVLPVVEPLITFLVLGFGLGQFVDLDGGRDYIEFLAPGMMAAFPMWHAFFICLWGSWIRMDSEHAYDAIIATPLEPEDVAAGEIAWATTMVLLTTFYVLLMSLAFGLVSSPLVVLTLPVAALHGWLLASMALSYSTSISSSSQIDYFFTIVALPMFWVGDVFFPKEDLPAAMQGVGWLMPLTHTVAVYRGLMEGAVGWGTLGDLAWLAVVAWLFFQLAMWRTRKRLVT